MPAPLNLVGERYGKLVVVSKAEPLTKARTAWNCECDCGVNKTIATATLRGGFANSCGCFRSEVTRERMTTHGRTGSPEHRTWKAMKQRCLDPNSASYPYYGGRGVEVCDRWVNSFEDFFSDVGPKPFPRAELDRIDNDGNYEPGNVRWVTHQKNCTNRRRKGTTLQ